MKTYFAILHKDPGSAVGVVFPDLPGCFSAGDSYDEAIRNAGHALRLYAQAEAEAGRELPAARPFDDLYADPEIRDEVRGAAFVAVPLRSSDSADQYSATDEEAAGHPGGFAEGRPPKNR